MEGGCILYLDAAVGVISCSYMAIASVQAEQLPNGFSGFLGVWYRVAAFWSAQKTLL